MGSTLSLSSCQCEVYRFFTAWRASLPLLYSDGEQVCTLARAASFRPPGDGERG